MSSPHTPSLRLELQQVQPEAAAGVELLSCAIEWMRFCYSCNRESIFVANRQCASGLIGRCSQCDDERIVPFTRTTLEAWESLT